MHVGTFRFLMVSYLCYYYMRVEVIKTRSLSIGATDGPPLIRILYQYTVHLTK